LFRCLCGIHGMYRLPGHRSAAQSPRLTLPGGEAVEPEIGWFGHLRWEVERA
jgi:hypothetical protein